MQRETYLANSIKVLGRYMCEHIIITYKADFKTGSYPGYIGELINKKLV